MQYARPSSCPSIDISYSTTTSKKLIDDVEIAHFLIDEPDLTDAAVIYPLRFQKFRFFRIRVDPYLILYTCLPFSLTPALTKVD